MIAYKTTRVFFGGYEKCGFRRKTELSAMFITILWT